VEAKLCAGPDGQETFVLCRSVQRREKEQAIDARFAPRIEQGLAKLGRRIERARKALDRGKLERQIDWAATGAHRGRRGALSDRSGRGSLPFGRSSA